MIVAWTGHRPGLFRDTAAARAAVEAVATDVVDQGAVRFLVGGQRGVDTWAALAASDRELPFSVFLPVAIDEFTREWAAADRAVLEQTLGHAAEIQVASTYRERNEWLARRGDLLVAVWTRTRGGGTAETVEFARAAGTPVREILLDPSEEAKTAEGRGV